MMCLLPLIFVALLGFYYLGNKNMLEIKFDLGQNIIETARNSGAPKYQTDNTAGWIEYSINSIPNDIPAHYTRPGYEITTSPLFAFSMNADEDDKNNLAVAKATLQFSSQYIKSHDSGQAFIEQLIGQFQKGKWQRYIDEHCPAVTGRSSLLDLSGVPDKGNGCALDPAYKLTREEWLHMMSRTQRYKWIGEEVIATLEVGYDNDARGITYNILLEFEDFPRMKKVRNTNLANRLKEGDAKGWNSTADHHEQLKQIAVRNKLLEENALKRGDQVIPR